MNISSIVYLQGTGVHLVGSCGHSWLHHIQILYKTCGYQILKYTLLKIFKGHVRYIIAMCQPKTIAELKLQNIINQKNHSPQGVVTHNVFNIQ
jgi:hypothetical protein